MSRSNPAGVDLVNEIIKLREAYDRLRGSSPKTGQISTSNRYFPRTTWADAFVIYSHVMKYAAPSVDDCASLLVKHGGKSYSDAKITCVFNGGPRDFVKTSGYNSAVNYFKSSNPVSKWWNSQGVDLMSEYPHNEQLWAGATRLMNERDAAGVAPYWSEIALESVVEAIEELPQTLKNAVAKVVPDPSKLLPNVGPWVTLLKWSSIAGGLYLFYSATKPKKKKKTST